MQEGMLEIPSGLDRNGKMTFGQQWYPLDDIIRVVYWNGLSDILILMTHILIQAAKTYHNIIRVGIRKLSHKG